MPTQLTQQTMTSLGRPASTYYSKELYVDPEIVAGLPDSNRTVAVYYFKQSVNRNVYLELGMAITSFSSQSRGALIFNRALAQRLCAEHPEISTDPGIYGGNPHIKNVRLTVGNVLAKLYVYGSTKAVADIYAPHVNEGHIKEAIAYAQDFLEAAIHPHKAPQGDGG